MSPGGTDGRTREDRATQPMDAGWLSFAIFDTKESFAKVPIVFVCETFQQFLPLQNSNYR